MTRLLVPLLLMFVGAAHAELRKLSEDEFGQNPTMLVGNLSFGADASSGLARYGIFLTSYPSGAPIAVRWIPPVDITPRPYPLITNQTTGDQAQSVLVIDFRHPVKKIGLGLFCAKPALEISITAADRKANIVGTLKETVGDRFDFVGFEASDNRTISKVVIDYGSAETPEQLFALVIDPTTPPRFETVLPQIAHGKLGADLLLSTTISIVNISNTTASGEIKFFAPGGQPLAPELGGSAHSEDVVPFSLYPVQTGLFSTSGKGGMAGYARVVSDAPVQAIAHFQVLGTSGRWSETAVASVSGRFRAVGPYSRQQSPATGVIGTVPPSIPPEPSVVDSALAIVNLASEPASVSLFLRDEKGFTRDKTVTLAPGEQLARFIDEIFEEQFAPQGTIRLSSDRPVAAVLIQTVNGLPVSILPLDSLEY
ncbi:MAG: hypothetical protein EHM23_03595 [Acidobacteria bacterium]|nr:MAG: hypothetical protein EHM23_03595 [Acidobacteriota bacterium]